MQLANKKRTLIFTVIVTTIVVCSMLSTALTTALPQIMEDFSLDAASGQWLTSIYSLVMGILVLCTAYLIKRFPTKNLYISSLLLFSIGVILNGFAQSFTVMMLGRIMQAAGNGILLSLGQVILLTIYPVNRRGSIMGVYGLASGAAPIIAPTLAGIIVDHWGWRMIFYSLAVLCIIALVVAFFAMDNVLENEHSKLNILSAILAVTGFTGILYGISNLGKGSIFQLSTGFSLILGIVACTWFSIRQFHLDIPFLNIRVLSHRRMRFATIGSVLFYLNMMALAVINPLFIQSACGRSATMSGLLMMPGSILMMLLSPIMGKLYDRIGIRKLFLGGALLLSLGTFFSGWCGGNMLVFAIANTIRCAAVAMLMMPLLTWGVSTLEKQDIASGQSLITSLRTISGALGSTIFMSLEAILEDSIGIMAAMQICYVGMTFVGVLVLVSAIAARRCD